MVSAKAINVFSLTSGPLAFAPIRTEVVIIDMCFTFISGTPYIGKCITRIPWTINFTRQLIRCNIINPIWDYY